jgi:hypothetical protein
VHSETYGNGRVLPSDGIGHLIVHADFIVGVLNLHALGHMVYCEKILTLQDRLNLRLVAHQDDS